MRGPVRVVLPRVGVDGFVGAAMYAPIRLVVTDEVDAAKRDTSRDRRFPDGRRDQIAAPLDFADGADVDGGDSSGGTIGDRRGLP